MSSARDWADILVASWQKPQPDALARTLQPLSWVYGSAVQLRRTLFNLGVLRSARAPQPLIVVGNLLAGGAGKTPTVIALVAALRNLGYTPGVISRGHGRTDTATRLVSRDTDAAHVGDEPLLIHLRAQVPVAVAGRRIEAARALCDAHPQLDLLIADDGLQHHALQRDAQLMVFDERGLGNGLLLPAGPLREPLPAAVPPHTLVLYNAGAPSTPLPGSLATRALAGVVELARWWRGEPADRNAWRAVQGSRIVACAGTAVPERFFTLLRAQGLAFEPIALPDHADYSALPWPADATDVVLTEKDAVKLPPQRTLSARVWVAPLDFGLDPAVAPALARWLPPPR